MGLLETCFEIEAEPPLLGIVLYIGETMGVLEGKELKDIVNTYSGLDIWFPTVHRLSIVYVLIAYS